MKGNCKDCIFYNKAVHQDAGLSTFHKEQGHHIPISGGRIVIMASPCKKNKGSYVRFNGTCDKFKKKV